MTAPQPRPLGPLPLAASALRRWSTRLAEPVDAASVGVFRIVFGLVVAWDAWRYLGYGWVDEYYVRPIVHFPYLGFEFVRPLPAPWMHAVHWGLSAAALLVAAGALYRAAATAMFLAYAYIFLCEKSVYMNHHYFMLLVCFLLLWIPADRAYAVCRLRRPAPPPVVPRWAVWILRFQIFVVYFYGAIAKLNPDWIRGEPMYSALVRHDPKIPQIAALLPPALLAYGIAWAGILIDFAVPVLLCFRRTFPIGFALAVAFHALNAVFLRIGVFSYLMVGAIPIFLPPAWPRRLAARLRGRPTPAPAGPWPSSGSAHSPALLLALHLYAAFQLLFPLRHLLYPGYVSWTEEGHRFAWHMKLREKRSRLTVIAAGPDGRWERRIEPAMHLIPRQQRKIETFPDMLVQYAHFLAGELRRHGVGDVVIRARWECSLNGRPWRLLVDPEADLSRVRLSLRPSRWILPLSDAPGEVGAVAACSAQGDGSTGTDCSSPAAPTSMP